MNKKAQDYELVAARLDDAGIAPAPQPISQDLALAADRGLGRAPLQKSRLFRRMLAWHLPASDQKRATSTSFQ
jgi:hypothetical protein